MIFIERAQKIVKKSLKAVYTKDIETKFEYIMTKIKKGNITNAEKIEPKVP